MEQIKKDFGFGCMRLPINGENIDTAETCRMVDAFLDAGFNYFDTARGYLQGKSELALCKCLTSRYPRERYILTDKLTAAFFKTEEHISVPDLFATMNTKQIHHDWNADYYYNVVHTAPGRRASDCVKCGRCKKVRPQHLPIRRLPEDVAKEFEKEAN